VNWKFGKDKRHRLFANFGQFVLDEVSADANDPYMLDFQGGAEMRFGEDPKNPVVKATLAAGYSRTFNLRLMGVASGSQPAGAATPGAQSTSPNRGNATRQPGGAVAPGNTLFYLDDFNIVNGRAEVAWRVCKDPIAGTPAVLTFSGEYIANVTDDYEDLTGSNITKNPGATDGWSLQVAFGGNRKQGEWQIAYQYKYLEADAVWDATADSDWGLGGTDREGHVVMGTYNVRDWWQLGVKAAITDKIGSRPNSAQSTRGGDGTEHLLRVQFDTVFKF
jgi:hypothetical protein